MTMRSAVYAGRVVHERLRPKRHRLQYRVFSMLLDLDELPRLDRRLRLFGYNRAAIFSFHDRDHGSAAEMPLRQWVVKLLGEAGIELGPGAIRVLCYPRIFGYVFNPLTVFFCYDTDERLLAILYEVSNTHGEKHTYVIPVAESDSGVIRQECRKSFFVSPFVSMNCQYRFRLIAPADKVVVSIAQADDGGAVLSAVFSGTRKDVNDSTLAAMLLRYPLMTIKIIAAIHVEALRLWLKGVPVLPYRPASRSISSSIAAGDTVRSGPRP